MFALKLTCIKHVIMISLLLEPSTVFHHDIWLCDFVTVTCAVTLTPNFKFQNRNEKEIENN